jgi:hypothetical protein
MCAVSREKEKERERERENEKIEYKAPMRSFVDFIV